MKIVFDKDGRVLGYADEGFDIDGGEEFCGPIPDGFGSETCRFYYRIAPDVLSLDKEKQQAALDYEAAQDELEKLYRWFRWYDQQIMQAMRGERMGENYSAIDSSGQLFNSIGDLDVQAKINQLRIREIRGY